MPGYESQVVGYANADKLIWRLERRGFTVHHLDGDRLLYSPTGQFTGMVVVDAHTVQGEDTPDECYGFEPLVMVLTDLPGLREVELHRVGQDEDDVEGYVYKDGVWYRLFRSERYVRCDQIDQLEPLIEQTYKQVETFGPPHWSCAVSPSVR